MILYLYPKAWIFSKYQTTLALLLNPDWLGYSCKYLKLSKEFLLMLYMLYKNVLFYNNWGQKVYHCTYWTILIIWCTGQIYLCLLWLEKFTNINLMVKIVWWIQERSWSQLFWELILSIHKRIKLKNDPNSDSILLELFWTP